MWFNRFVAALWAVPALLAAALAVSTLVTAFSGPNVAFVAVLAFGGLFCLHQAWRAFHEPPDPAPRRRPAAPSAPPPPTADQLAALQAQIDAFAAAGLVLTPEVALEEIIRDWGIEALLEAPYDRLLLSYCENIQSGPHAGAPRCDRAFTFESERIFDTGSYAGILQSLGRVTGRENLISDIEVTFEPGAREGRVAYKAGAAARSYDVRLDSAWIEPDFIAQAMADIEAACTSGRRFWSTDNGQATFVFFVSPETARAINLLVTDTRLSGTSDLDMP